MRGKLWVIAADGIGAALLVALLCGGTKSGLFAAILIALPIAFCGMMLASSGANEP